MISFIPRDATTGVSDLDVLPVSPAEKVTRTCTCGHVMKLEIEKDEYGDLKGIDCIEGCYLRNSRGSEFGLGQQESTFLYCGKCRHRRSWRLFKEK